MLERILVQLEGFFDLELLGVVFLLFGCDEGVVYVERLEGGLEVYRRQCFLVMYTRSILKWSC